MTAELEHAEQVMLEHEKEKFSDKHKHHKEKAHHSDAGNEKYSSLYSSFDELKPHEDLPPGLHKVFCVTCRYRRQYPCVNFVTKNTNNCL